MGSSIKHWIQAFRLRTLPLAFSSIIAGSALAYYHFSFKVEIFLLALVTTLFLQVLSNLANDYGDSDHGVDNADRVGPDRAVQSGAISKSAMKKAMILFSIFSLASGLPLVYIGASAISLKWAIIFLVLGIGSIIAAIKYTAGKNPYGYRGLGDVFVFVFFGFVGVLGTFVLHFQYINRFIMIDAISLACSIGLLSAAVLNLNNMRDRVNDSKHGKITLAVRMGKSRAKVYHGVLILGAIANLFVFADLHHFSTINALVLLIPVTFLFVHLFKVLKIEEEKEFDPELKKVALSTFLISIILMLSSIISF